MAHMIIDDNGVIWSSSSADSLEDGMSILNAVENNKRVGYKDAIGEDWQGDLVLAEEVRRIR